MIRGVKRFARSAAGLGGVSALARRLTARRPRILMYHNFCGETGASAGRTSASMFRQQLMHLRRHYRPVPLKELAKQLSDGVAPATGSVAITVDDGHANFVRFALPVLEELAIPATFFVLSELSDGRGWLWTDKWEYARDRATISTGAGPTLAEVKRVPAAERDLWIDDFARRVGVEIPSQPPASYELVSWQELKELARRELIDIGSHSRTHRLLSDADEAESWDEIYGSRRDLERRLEVEIAAFCFPFGLPGDYRAEHAEMVARAGYSCAAAAHFGYVTGDSNRFALPRIGGVFHGMARFRQELDGLEYLRLRIRRERPA